MCVGATFSGVAHSSTQLCALPVERVSVCQIHLIWNLKLKCKSEVFMLERPTMECKIFFSYIHTHIYSNKRFVIRSSCSLFANSHRIRFIIITTACASTRTRTPNPAQSPHLYSLYFICLFYSNLISKHCLSHLLLFLHIQVCVFVCECVCSLYSYEH